MYTVQGTEEKFFLLLSSMLNYGNISKLTLSTNVFDLGFTVQKTESDLITVFDQQFRSLWVQIESINDLPQIALPVQVHCVLNKYICLNVYCRVNLKLNISYAK